MKIALLLPGQARFININWPNIKSQLLDVGDVDVFCHFWDTVDPRWDSDPYKAIELFQPKHYVIEKQLDFDDPSLVSEPKFEELDVWKYRRARSQFYSIQRSFEVMTTYSELHKVNYDCVVKARTDIVLKQPFSEEEFSTDRNALWSHNVIDAPEGVLYDDELVFGSVQTMADYCSAYHRIPAAVCASGKICNAVFWRHNIEACGLDANVKVSRVGRVDIIRNTWHEKRLDALNNGEVPQEDE